MDVEAVRPGVRPVNLGRDLNASLHLGERHGAAAPRPRFWSRAARRWPWWLRPRRPACGTSFLVSWPQPLGAATATGAPTDSGTTNRFRDMAISPRSRFRSTLESATTLGPLHLSRPPASRGPGPHRSRVRKSRGRGCRNERASSIMRRWRAMARTILAPFLTRFLGRSKTWTWPDESGPRVGST